MNVAHKVDEGTQSGSHILCRVLIVILDNLQRFVDCVVGIVTVVLLRLWLEVLCKVEVVNLLTVLGLASLLQLVEILDIVVVHRAKVLLERSFCVRIEVLCSENYNTFVAVVWPRI